MLHKIAKDNKKKIKLLVIIHKKKTLNFQVNAVNCFLVFSEKLLKVHLL